MEILNNKIKKFLNLDYGYGSGDGSGYGLGYGTDYGSGYGTDYGSGYGTDDSLSDGSGDGYGSGDGSGYSSGYGSGYGTDYGSGYCSGYGLGLKTLFEKTIYRIDGVNTIIEHINKNVAKGKIVNKDLTVENCYIVKGNNKFAHGKNLKEAMESLQKKLFEDMDEEEAIEKFREKFKQKNRKYKASEFYLWHHILTGSCEMGRKNFAKNHNIDIENDKYTVIEFIEKTENDYGGEIIKKLKEYYN